MASREYTELATRLILNCSGSAFKKLQLHQEEVTKNDAKSIQRIIEILGGHWGQIALEQKYEFAERAIFRCQQKSDESADSYLARADIMWTELTNKALKLSGLQAYITLRGSTLNAEDKKRVLADADISDQGELTVKRVAAAIRMLGAGFFHEMTHGKRNTKLKTYDQALLVAESMDVEEPESLTFATDAMDDDEVSLDTLIQDGDEDAALVSDFETAATDLVQSDEELAAAFTAYTDARRRLNEKVRSRGFWPIQAKGKSKGFQKGTKGKFSKGHMSSRKSLQQRILESRCRICGKQGHWKAECPNKGDTSASSARPPQAPTSFAHGGDASVGEHEPDALPLEFLQLPVAMQSTIDESQPVQCHEVFVTSHAINPKEQLSKTLSRWQQSSQPMTVPARNDEAIQVIRDRLRRAIHAHADAKMPKASECEIACFATHGSFGVVDLGATKTVIGSQKVSELINSLHPEVRKNISRCPCQVSFRFGNHGVLQSQQALVVPIHGLLLKIAIVPGETPFLLSNTLLRAIGAIIDTERKVLKSTLMKREIPLTLTSKGLFLLDLNELAHHESEQANFSNAAETHTAMCDALPPTERVESLPEGLCQNVANANNHNPMPDPHETLKLPENNHHSRTDDQHAHQVTTHPIKTGSSEPPKQSPRSKCQLPGIAIDHGDSHVAVQEAPTGAGDQSTCAFGLLPVVLGRPRGVQDRLWQTTARQEVSSGVGGGTTLGEVVRPALRDIHEDGASKVHPLRQPEGGTSREQWPDGASDPSHGSSQECAEERDHDQGQSQEPDTSTVTRTPMPVGRCGRPQCLHSDRGQHREPGERASGGRHVPCQPTGDPSDADRERSGPSDELSGAEPCSSAARTELRGSECPSVQASRDAGDPSADCMISEDMSPETNREKQMFHRWVNQYTEELDILIQQHVHQGKFSQRIDVMEIFCGEHSQLTHQCNQLGFKAERFGYAQGDLQTSVGRQSLFQRLAQCRPRHVWVSPSCGPWSGFSTLNGSRSIAAWDELQALRHQHLSQVALCVVIFRFQRSQRNHFHWEQPRGSLMFKLPYLQEVFYYLLATDVDLCTAGDMRDPTNGKHIRKTLTILTSSKQMVQQLSMHRCSGQHEHQVIEGQVKVSGETMNRSRYTENYPRKFARKLAIMMCKVKTMKEGIHQPPEFPVLAEEHPSEPARKRMRLCQTYRPKVSRARGVETLQWGKRRKCTGKTQTVDTSQAWKIIFDKVNEILPRVGKVVMNEPEIMSRLKDLIQDKSIKHVVACRGSSRTLAPPDHVIKGESPYRKSIFTARGTGEIKAEEDWENWETLAKRNLIRPSHECRINITVFASEFNSASSETLVRQPAESADATPIQTRPGDPGPANSENLQPGKDEVPDPGIDVPEPKASETFVEGLTPSQLHDLRSSSQSNRFKELSPEERSMIIRAHKNLGHPSPERLSTMLRSQGYRAEIAKAALELKCSVCKSQAQPRLARPGTIKDELDFNDRICIDGLQWTNRHGQNFHVYHIVDWATSFQTACCAPDRTTNAAIQGLFQMWFSWAGAPSEMIVDAATEFNSDEFQNFSQSHNIKVTTISIEAQFQNGKAERHGSILKTMLSKYEAEHTINNYKELQEALWWCTQAKNSCGLRKGYAPEVLVLGKHTRIPGAISSDELLPAHLLADSETAQGVQFRKQLAMRECARRAFHHADNDAALRRSILRRDRPGTSAYSPGEWVMIWRAGKGGYPGAWTGPMKIVVQENTQTIWSTSASKLFRSAPEHVRPVTAAEARDIPISHHGPPVSIIAQQIPWNSQQGLTRALDLTNEITHNLPSINPQSPQNNIIPNPSPPENNINPENPESQSEGQPDGEPEAPQSLPSVSQAGEPADGGPSEVDHQVNDPAVNTPVPEDDDDLVCDSLVCCDDDPCCFSEAIDLAWRFEVDIRQQDLENWRQETECSDMAFVASAAKRQRSEVKISTLSSSEKAEFQKAKNTEINNWIKTGTISKILREKIPREQILRCRWILTWKPIDEDHQDKMNAKDPKRVKAKARLVILGYMDPQLEDLPRDSPTLGLNSKMILLQLIASMGWDLKSFDIKAAFLQGKPTWKDLSSGTHT